jgi:hypothetical protein
MARVIRVTWTDTGRTEPIAVDRIVGLSRGRQGGTNVTIADAAHETTTGTTIDSGPPAKESFEEVCCRIAADDETAASPSGAGTTAKVIRVTLRDDGQQCPVEVARIHWLDRAERDTIIMLAEENRPPGWPVGDGRGQVTEGLEEVCRLICAPDEEAEEPGASAMVDEGGA